MLPALLAPHMTDGVFVLKVHLEPSSLDSLRASCPWRSRQHHAGIALDGSLDASVDIVAAPSTILDASIAPSDHYVTAIHSPAGFVPARRDAPDDGPMGESSRDDIAEALFGDRLAALGLGRFRAFLEGRGIRSASELEIELGKLDTLGALSSSPPPPPTHTHPHLLFLSLPCPPHTLSA